MTDQGYPYRTKRGFDLLSRTKPDADGRRRGGPHGNALLCDGPSRSRPGWVCERVANTEKNDSIYCQRHGARNVKGLAHPRFRPGRYAASLPPRYRRAFDRALSSRDLADLRGELAMVEARVVELSEQLTRSESGELWARLSDARLGALAAAAEVRRCEAAEDVAGVAKARAEQNAALAAMFTLIEQGGKDHEVWSQLLDAVERKRKIAESQTRKAVAERTSISLEVYAGAMADIGRVLREKVRDKTVLAEIGSMLGRLLPSGEDEEIVVEAEEGDEDDED